MGRLFHLSHRASYHIRPVSTIPKPYIPGTYCLIVDLSFPNISVTDSDWCSLTHANSDLAAALVKKLGKSSLLAKLELQLTSEVFQYGPRINHFLLTSEKLYLRMLSFHLLYTLQQICSTQWQTYHYELCMPGHVIGCSPP